MFLRLAPQKREVLFCGRRRKNTTLSIFLFSLPKLVIFIKEDNLKNIVFKVPYHAFFSLNMHRAPRDIRQYMPGMNKARRRRKSHFGIWLNHLLCSCLSNRKLTYFS